MRKKHDESKDLAIVGRVCRVTPHDKTIQANKAAVIGIRMWGRIDYLTRHCGWYFMWNNDVAKTQSVPLDIKKSSREIKKESKAPKLTDKTKRK